MNIFRYRPKNVLLQIALLSLLGAVGCTVNSNDPTPSTTTNTTPTSIGTAEVTVFNGVNLQLNKSIEIYYEDVSNKNKDVLLKSGLSPSGIVTLNVPLFNGVPSEINFYFKDNTQASGLWRGKASGSFSLEKGKKYTIIVWGASMESSLLLDNANSNSAAGKAYVRGINLNGIALRIKKTATAGDADVDVPVGPYNSSATKYLTPSTGDYTQFTPVFSGSHVVQAIDYTYSSGGSINTDLGSKTLDSGKSYTIVIQVSATTGKALYSQIVH